MFRIILIPYLIIAACWTVGGVLWVIRGRHKYYKQQLEEWIRKSDKWDREPDINRMYNGIGDELYPVIIPGGIFWPLTLLLMVIYYPYKLLSWWFGEGVFLNIQRKVISKHKAIALTSPNEWVRQRAQAVLKTEEKEDAQ